MRINDIEDLCVTALKRPVKREELEGWRPNIVLTSVNHLTGGLCRLGPVIGTLEEAYELLESNDLPRLHEEFRKLEEKCLREGGEW